MMIMPKCERCRNQQEGPYAITMSYFNTQLICETCERKEQAHPKYQQAKQAEIEAIKTGNYDFRGIGLPKELNT